VVMVDLSQWTRSGELLSYAANRGITPADAIRELVNTGLSNQT
jgi:hypothetical protein